MFRHGPHFDPYYNQDPQSNSGPNRFHVNPPGGAPDHYHGNQEYGYPGANGYHGDHEGEAGINGDKSVIDVVHGLDGDTNREDNLEEDGAENTNVFWRKNYNLDGEDEIQPIPVGSDQIDQEEEIKEVNPENMEENEVPQSK